MQMLLTHPQKRSHAAVVQPVGSLNAENAIRFQYQLNAVVMSDEHSSLLVDMKQVELIDSAGLMALVNVLRLARSSNKRFCLCSVSRPVRIILELTQVDKVLEIFESRAAFNTANC
ncbi:MAG: STAS domain-containing protein [Leptolyngbyaceae cyanobacterium RU_5_1]|nr:STAS domain-containing protein [Leptolyngbyaceae cyanobacterium RU_5_1]